MNQFLETFYWGTLWAFHIKSESQIKIQLSPNRHKKNVYFHLSHYKFTENICCHGNQTYHPTGITSSIYVEANVINMYSPTLWRLRRKILNFFSNINPFCRPGNQLNSAIWTKSYETFQLFNQYFCKEISKYPHWDRNNC